MKILKDSAIYLVGEIVSKSVPFLLLPYLSRKLGVEGYGELSYYETYIFLLVIFIGLSQEGAVARYFYFYGKNSLDMIVKAGYAYTIIIGGVFLSVCYFFNSEILYYIVLVAILKSFISVQLSIRQCQKQASSYVFIQLLSVLTSALITILMLEYYETNLVEKRILSDLFSKIIVFSFSYYLYKKHTKSKKFSIRQLKLAFLYVIGFGIPLVFHRISFFIKGQVDKIFLYHKFSEKDLGLYAMGATLATTISVLILAINFAVLPYYYEALKKNQFTIKQIYKWVLYSFIVVPIPSLVIWLIPESTILWFLGKGIEFMGVKYYILVFSITMTLMIPYLLLVNYLFYHGKNKMISISSILSSGIYLLFLLFFLKFNKIEYVPYASIISAVSMVPILYFMTKRVNIKR